MLRRFALSVLISGWFAALAPGADWNQWRGPNRSGVAVDAPPLTDAWGKDGPPRLWQSEKLPGGNNSISIAGGKAFVMMTLKLKPAIDGVNSHEVVYCLDEHGKTVWKKAYAGKGSASTCCVADGRVYAVGSQGLYCLDALTGKELWKAALKRQDVASSPLVVDGMVVVLGGVLLAFDAVSGRTLWEQPRLEGANPSPVLWSHGDQRHVLCNTNQGIACIALKTGEILWKSPGGGNGTLAVRGDIAVLLNADAKIGLEAIRLTTQDGRRLWSVAVADRGSTPVIHDGCVYVVGANRAGCYGLEKGDLKWEQRFQCEIASPFIADGKVFGLVENGGRLLMIRATPAKFELLGKFPVAADRCASPALADGKLYLQTSNGVVCFDLRTR